MGAFLLSFIFGFVVPFVVRKLYLRKREDTWTVSRKQMAAKESESGAEQGADQGSDGKATTGTDMATSVFLYSCLFLLASFFLVTINADNWFPEEEPRIFLLTDGAGRSAAHYKALLGSGLISTLAIPLIGIITYVFYLGLTSIIPILRRFDPDERKVIYGVDCVVDALIAFRVGSYTGCYYFISLIVGGLFWFTACNDLKELAASIQSAVKRIDPEFWVAIVYYVIIAWIGVRFIDQISYVWLSLVFMLAAYGISTWLDWKKTRHWLLIKTG